MSETPDWFEAALAQQPEVTTIHVDGASIRYRQWGTSGERDVILVHGGAAHSRWWDHIAPQLATHGRVVALDLSGHGDSDHRSAYSLQQWGAEVLAAGVAAGLTAPTIIGHSLGGLITLSLLTTAGNGVNDAIMVDSPVGGPNAERLPEARDLVIRRPRLYATEDEVIARFRPVPAQPSIPAIADYVARNSVREFDGGFSWKFDGKIFDGATELVTDLPPIDGRLAFFRAEHGLVSADARTILEGAGAQFIEIPNAGHAPMLDQPIALVTGIRSVFAGWAQPN